jgi:type IV secretion system protein VirD4
MVSRQETARPLLTAGEIMQLPPTEEIVLVSGLPPIRARKARYYEDAQLNSRILPLPSGNRLEAGREGISGDQPAERHDDWTPLLPNAEPDQPIASGLVTDPSSEDPTDADNAGIRGDPTLPAHEAITPEQLTLSLEQLTDSDDDFDVDTAHHTNACSERMAKVARQTAMDPDDGLGL